MSKENRLIGHARCPTPHKYSYISKQKAREFANKNGGAKNIYKCDCGNYHLSKMTREEYQASKPFLNRPDIKMMTKFKKLLKR